MEYWAGTPGYSRGTARVQACAAAAARPRAACAVLSCADAYVSGAAGSNACPAGSVRIEAEAACRAAAALAGKTVDSRSVETRSEYPRGCYYSNNDAYFNKHPVGAGNSRVQLLCATGAPLKRCRRTDARSACTGARACRHRGCTARHSRAACVIHGAHIDTHTYTNRYNHTHTHIPV